MSEPLEYELAGKSGITILEIQILAKEAWSATFEEGTFSRKAALDAGIDIAGLPSSIDNALTLRPSGAGFDPTSILLIVGGALGPTLSKAASDMWKYVLLPRIRARWGDHSLKAKRKSE